jgi:NAD(P) transhydrogenase
MFTIPNRLVPFMDAEISDVLAQTFASLGMRVVLRSGVATVERSRRKLQVVLAGGERLEPDTVLFAAGRAGNTEGLGLEAAGVQTDPRGRIVVDARYRTTADGVTRPATSSAHQR